MVYEISYDCMQLRDHSIAYNLYPWYWQRNDIMYLYSFRALTQTCVILCVQPMNSDVLTICLFHVLLFSIFIHVRQNLTSNFTLRHDLLNTCKVSDQSFTEYISVWQLICHQQAYSVHVKLADLTFPFYIMKPCITGTFGPNNVGMAKDVDCQDYGTHSLFWSRHLNSPAHSLFMRSCWKLSDWT